MVATFCARRVGRAAAAIWGTTNAGWIRDSYFFSAAAIFLPLSGRNLGLFRSPLASAWALCYLAFCRRFAEEQYFGDGFWFKVAAGMCAG